MKAKTNISIMILFCFLLFILGGCTTQSASGKKTDEKNGDKTIHIGYQKFGSLNFLKAKGVLEKKLKPLGYKVKWTEFPGGPQLLEALNVGSLDFGHTGEAPPIFAQAADAPLVYFANEPANPKGEAILVPKDSKIKSIKDLKGKKVALNKGSNVHYLLVRALEENGLKYEDIETAFLPPSDARTAFEKGAVDAWVIWDPYLAEAQKQTGARILLDGTGLVHNREYFLTSKSFAKKHSEVLDIVIEELEKEEEWVSNNKSEAAKFLAPQIGMDQETLEVVLEGRPFGIEKITDERMNDQQKIANKFFELKLIPKKINISDAKLNVNQ